MTPSSPAIRHCCRSPKSPPNAGIRGAWLASITDIDNILREQAGFRLGPFELLDLAGLDVSHAVMESIYRLLNDESRYVAATSGTAGMFAASGRLTPVACFTW
jgi:hypothetical protein